MRVGFIGTGSIGQPMAGQVLAAGFSLAVHDINRSAATPLLEAGAEWADSPKAVAQQCDIVCTCLPGPPEFQQVVYGANGILEGIAAGSVLVDHTTNSPELVRDTHRRLERAGVAMLDAPVSGGAEGARTRDLTMLVGGNSDTLGRCNSVLDAIAKTVMHVGDIGAGCVCKIAHNCAGFSLDMATIECLTMGVRAGVEPSVLVEVFQKCAIGRNFNLHTRLPDTLFSGDFEPRFALKTAMKDMRLATDLAEHYGVPMNLTNVCQAEMEEAMTRGWADLDSSAFLRLQEERSGVQLRLV